MQYSKRVWECYKHNLFAVLAVAVFFCGLLLIIIYSSLQKTNTTQPQTPQISTPIADQIYFEEYPPVDGAEAEIPAFYKINNSSANLPIKYNLLPTQFAKRRNPKKAFLAFFVKSKANHFRRRRVIRKTWGSFAKIGAHKIAIIFVTGLSKRDIDNQAIVYENECFQDILQTSHPDTFSLLSLKTLSAFRWIKNISKIKSSFYIFADDDCVIDVFNTLQFLETQQTTQEPGLNYIYCGFQYEHRAGVIRGNGKFGVSLTHYPSDSYPSFCRGVMVILTYEVIREIYDVSTVTNYMGFPLEDVMVYGILRSKLNSSHIRISPVINHGHPLVFYPWDNKATAVAKMQRHWERIEVPYDSMQLRKIQHSEKTCLNYMNMLKPNDD